MPTALISVSCKDGIIEFARELKKIKWNIVSSCGTGKILRENDIECKEISDITDFPEILDGRVKTLDPKIHGGILAIRNNHEHLNQLKKYGIDTIDMVVVNLYPFESTINNIEKPQNKNISQDVIENIDIGGVALLRAAAKNYKDVLVICDRNDYILVVDSLKNNLFLNDLRLTFAAKAFRYTAYYDSLISTYLTYEKFPEQFTVPLKKLINLRYGENPHQAAALYSNGTEKNKSVVISAKQLHGKELSYNNYLDLEAAWRLVHEFEKPACAIIKHNNPCGCAESENLKDSYSKALSCDPISAFGSIIAFNKSVDFATAQEISTLFVECIIACDYSKEALSVLMQQKNIRLLKQDVPYIPYKKENDVVEYRSMANGMLVQDRDDSLLSEIKVMTKRSPTKEENNSLEFAWKVAKHVKSNAIVLVRGLQTVGIGTGQMSRIDSLKIAVEKMKQVKHNLDKNKNPLVLASDAFFPFSDVVEESFKANVTAIAQPGGSIRDSDSIKAADDRNIAMIQTGTRHFKH